MNEADFVGTNVVGRAFRKKTKCSEQEFLRDILANSKAVDHGHIDKDGNKSLCWDWQGRLANTGYPDLNFIDPDTKERIRRCEVVIRLRIGRRINGDHHAGHDCDGNRSCIRHIREMTREENARMAAKKCKLDGTKKSKPLTDLEVAILRVIAKHFNGHKNHWEIAAIYEKHSGRTAQNLCAAISGRNYSRVKPLSYYYTPPAKR